jgi:hypothetical protein
MQIELRSKAKLPLNLIPADGYVFSQFINRRSPDWRFLTGNTQTIFQQSGCQTHGPRRESQSRSTLLKGVSDGLDNLSHRMHAAVSDIEDLTDGCGVLSGRDGRIADISFVNESATIAAVAD